MEYGKPSGRGHVIFVFALLLMSMIASVLALATAAVVTAEPAGATDEETVVPASSSPAAQPDMAQQMTRPIARTLGQLTADLPIVELGQTVSALIDDARSDTELVGGSRGLAVAILQQRLTDLGYRPGAVDGAYGAQTASAVLAFQKFESLPRTHTATSEVLDRMWAPEGAGPRQDILGTRVEIDLERQVMIVIAPGGDYRIINTSTGGNYEYTDPRSGNVNVAYTPTGNFAVGYRYDGMEVAPLGELYRPLYFYGGWAIHGSTSVPEYPASHGCARTSFVDQDWIWDAIPSGTPVYVY